MAFRRRRVYRRKPVRRLARRRRFQRRRRYHRSSGNLFCKLTKISSYTVDPKLNNIWDGSFKMEDFPEFKKIYTNFESVKLYKVRVTVLPMQNVSNNSSSTVTSYCMVPWHYPIDLPKAYNNYLSSDKARVFRQTAVGTQSYVPNVLTCTSYRDMGAAAPFTSFDNIVWRPNLRADSSTTDQATLPRVFAGIIAFQGDETVAGEAKPKFNIKMDVWVKFKNQTMMNV